ncbi:energy transducer TonB [Candidatus Fermentibacterales bacterium]|nr:energy transducer TonB [Candidatus Fermentibacterales bacterium]
MAREKHERGPREGAGHAGEAASGMETGVAVSLAVVLAVFEIFPSFGYGRLARVEADDQMQGYEADVIYEVPLPPDEDPDIDIHEIIDRDDFDMDRPDQILNLRDDTVGLQVIDTIDPDLIGPEDPDRDNGIPEPWTFVPHAEPPYCTYRPVPQYPDIARQAGVEGTVQLQLFVSESGRVERVLVAQSSGLSSLDSAAVSSARNSSWLPARRDDGTAVGIWTAMMYRFVLEN